jgi:uncharacterized protein
VRSVTESALPSTGRGADPAPGGVDSGGATPGAGTPAASPGAVSAADWATVTAQLGRAPRCTFDVVVRAPHGTPVVIRNPPLLDDGTPMPTRYWLTDRDLNRRIGTLEAAGGVRRAEAEVDPAELAAAHARYAAERDAALPAGYTGPRPSGGVGGTRIGVKCLHTHYAWFLAGGDDPVGRWVDAHLRREAPPDGAAGPVTAELPGAGAGAAE